METGDGATVAVGSDLVRVSADRTTSAEDWITLALSTWLIGGLFLDGYAHTYVIDTATEDFFTPWHAVFYTGFACLAGWIGWIGYRRQAPGPLLGWFPVPYRPAVLGLIIFAIGGVGDGLWHTAFGVEVGIDALLSPTHMILFVGGLLMLWTPVRSSAARADRSPLLALGTASLVTALLVFFINYLWLLPFPWFAQQTYDGATGTGSGTVQMFLGGAVASSAVLLGPLLLVSRRWRLPFGSAAVVWGVAAAMEAPAFSQRLGSVVIVVLAGLVFDVVAAATGRRVGLRAAAFAGPAALFAGYLVMARLDGPVAWPPEIWGGLVAVAGFVGLGLVLIQESGRQPLPGAHDPS